MKSPAHILPLLLFTCPLLSLAADHPECVAQFKAEEARIQRDLNRAMTANPPGKDVQAQQQLMAPVQQALKAAAERAEQCNRDKSSATLPARQQREELCMQQSHKQLAELRQRHASTSKLTRAEQDSIREQENRILDERHTCSLKAR